MTSRGSGAATAAFLFVLALGVGLGVTWRGLNPLDEGALVHTAERLADGEILYRDVATGLVPGSYHLQAWIFRLFGPSLASGRVLMALLLAISTLSVHLVLARWTSRFTAIALGAGFFLWQAIHWRFLGYSGQANTLVLLALLALGGWLAGAGAKRLYLAALLIGLAAVFKQNTGAYAAMGLFVFLFVEPWLPANEPAPDGRIRRVIALGALVALPTVVVAVYYLAHGAFAEFFDSTVLLPFSSRRGAFLLPYPPLLADFETVTEVVRANLSSYSPLEFLTRWAHDQGLSWQSIFLLAQIHYYVPLGLLLLAALLYVGPWPLGLPAADRRMRILTLILSGFLFLGVFPRPDHHHLVMAAPTLLVLGGFVAHDLIRAARFPWVVRALVCLVLLPWLSLNLLVTGSWLHSPDPSERKSAWLDLPRADLLVTADRRERVRAVVETVHRVTGEDDADLAVLAPDSLYYFLTGKRNPFRYPLILPGALDEEEIVRTLEEQRTPYVLFTSETFNHRRFSQDMPRLYRHLKRHYHAGEHAPIAGLAFDLSLLERISVEPAPPERIGFENGGCGNGDWRPVADLLENLSSAELLLASPWESFRRRLRPGTYLRPGGWLFRDAILATAGAGLRKTLVTYRLRLPEAPALRTAVGIKPSGRDERDSDGAFFEIYLYAPASAERRRLFARHLDPLTRPEDRRWQPLLIDLAPWQGREVFLALVTSGGVRLNHLGGRPVRPDDRAGWGEPAIVACGRGGGTGSGAILDRPELPSEVVTDFAGFRDLDLFLDAARSEPEDADIAFALALAEERLVRERKVGRTDPALREPVRRPAQAALLTELGELRRDQGRRGEAERLFSLALVLDPLDSRASSGLERLRAENTAATR